MREYVYLIIGFRKNNLQLAAGMNGEAGGPYLTDVGLRKWA